MPFTGDGLKVHGIGEFISAHFLKVPVNQRSYMWEKDNVEDFWNDIINAMNEPTDADYFIGSIVLSGSPGAPLEVVDGQQRLATTTIILGAIRDYYRENNHTDRANSVESHYLIKEDEDTLRKDPRLSLNTDDNLFFKNLVVLPSTTKRGNPLDAIKGKNPKDSHKNIAVAAKTIRDFVFQHVAGARSGDAVNRLKRIYMYIRDKVKVITVTVPTDDDAYTIFETLNDRGLDLTKADLLKNHLFRAAGKEQKDVETKWATMIGALETINRKEIIVDYIRYLWIATNGKVRAKALYKDIKRQVSEQGQAVEFANNLAENAVTYAGMLNSDHQKWSEYGSLARADLSNLIMLGIERMHPITLAMVKTFTVPEARKAFYYLVCASVRILIASPAPGGQFEERIAEVAPLITDGTITTAKALAAKMNETIVPNDAEFKSEFAMAKVSRTDLAAYYLRAMNNSFDAQEKFPARVIKDQAKSNVEHVLPINPSAAWKVKPDVAKAFHKRIGNLVLLSPEDNSKVGNQDFLTVKAPVYRKANAFELTKTVGKIKDGWDEVQIEKVQKAMAEIAVRTWPITVK